MQIVTVVTFLYKKNGLKELLLRLTKWRYNVVYYINDIELQTIIF